MRLRIICGNFLGHPIKMRPKVWVWRFQPYLRGGRRLVTYNLSLLGVWFCLSRSYRPIVKDQTSC